MAVVELAAGIDDVTKVNKLLLLLLEETPTKFGHNVEPRRYRAVRIVERFRGNAFRRFEDILLLRVKRALQCLVFRDEHNLRLEISAHRTVIRFPRDCVA